MRRLLTIVLIFIATCSQGRTLYATKGSGGEVVLPSGVSAGDTVRVRASLSPYTWLYVDGLNGSEGSPIVLMNVDDIANGQPDSVKLTYDITIVNCHYLTLTGTGSGAEYGFYVTDDTGAENYRVGVRLQGLCTDITAEHIRVSYKGFGVWIKNEEPGDYPCDVTYRWPARFYRIRLNHIKSTNVWSDNFYIGSSSSENDYYHERPVTCSGVTVYPRPTGLGWITVENCYLENSNRQGIQWSGVDTGTNIIRNNVILHCGWENNVAQGAGIAIGSSAYNTEVYGNQIKDTYRQGIYSYGVGIVSIHDNNIDSSGYLGPYVVSGQASIMVNNFHNPPYNPYTTFQVYRNSLGADTYGGAVGGNIEILRTLEQFTTDSEIWGNTSPYGVTVSAATGSVYRTTAPAARASAPGRGFRIPSYKNVKFKRS